MLGSLVFASGGGHGTLGLHEFSLLWSSLAVVAIVLLTAIAARNQVGLIPKGVAAVYEHIFDWLEDFAYGFMGREGRSYVPLACSFFLYILISNWMGLIPWPTWHDAHGGEISVYESPTISISTTLALAVLAVSAFNLLGLKKAIFGLPADPHDHDHGHGAPGGISGLSAWVAKHWDPVPMIYQDLKGLLKLLAIPLFFLFLLLNVMDRFLPLISLSLRLYGNISAKHTVKVSLLVIMQELIPKGDPLSWGLVLVLFGATCFVALLGALAGFLQAMIFTVLLLSYIGHAVHSDH